MRLILPITLNCVLVLLVYLAGKTKLSAKIPYAVRQIVIGLLFGALSAFASEFGMEWLGAVVNVRDAAPLSAGLIFGGPSGIIAGLIGGLYRWFSVAWGAGTYTRLACSLATILAGCMAAGLRKYMFDGKRPTWGYAIAISVVCEVVHMMLIFLTNMTDSYSAFEFVKGASVPMILGNSIAVGASFIFVALLSHERLTYRKGNQHISQTFQRWLLVCIVVAYIITATFTFVLQNGVAKIDTEQVFTTAINDVKGDVRGKSDEYMLRVALAVSERFDEDYSEQLATIAEEFNVAEINIFWDDGLITNSTNESVVGVFNMYDSEQSREFMVLAEGAETFVQEYGPMGLDNTIMRKYAGFRHKDGYFVQIGYDSDQFHAMLDEFVVDVTMNRHVGSGGFVAVCDENLNLVTKTDRNGKHISTIGIEPTEEMLAGKSATELVDATIVNSENGYKETFQYVYTFVEGYCIIAAMPKAEAMFMRDASLYTSVFMQVLIFATLFVFIYILIKSVIINNLRKINGTLGQIAEGNLNVTVDVRSNQEFASLSDDINTTVSTLKRYISEAAARIDKELEYAKQIQISALPTNFPDRDDHAIYAQMIAAKEVGGDFYDFYKLNDSTVAFLAADVSGKGIPAAMFMMTAKTILKDLAESGLDVNEIFTRANEKLCESNEAGMFVTAWMGILDLKTGVLRYANAGHNPPLLKHDNGSFEFLRSRAGFVLAGMEGVRYRVNELTLAPGDRIFLYTDGVTEATNTETQLYGDDRLLSFMNRNVNVKATELLPMLKADIDEFVGEAPQFDDITMLLFDYKPNMGGDIMSERVFPAKVDALTDVLAFVEETMEACDCPMKTTMGLCVAIEEVFVNVAHYAYPESEGDVSLAIDFDAASRTVSFRMTDGGVPFDPLKKPDPDITLSAEERGIGGLGIFITKKTMDTVSYSYENEKNILTMIKKI